MTEDKNFHVNGKKFRLSKRHHMVIPWNQLSADTNVPTREASINKKASIVGRVGIILLSCGTGAWRVREAMNTISRSLGLTCSADIGLLSISFTCFDQRDSYSQVLSLARSGVNTDKLDTMERFVRQFNNNYSILTIKTIHELLDRIERKSGNYNPFISGLAAGLACAAFIFLLGGGLVEMFCSFFGAGVGNWTRKVLAGKRITGIACIAVGVAVACVTYLALFKVLGITMHVDPRHEVGYIGAMLFVIPGFPFITSMLDVSKQDMRSGLERLSYAIMIIIVATLVGWLVALTVHFKPGSFLPLGFGVIPLMLLRIPASFCGVFGFSIMFNSPYKMAMVSGLIGAFANTLRLELIDLTAIPAGAAAFCGALLAGLLASLINRRAGYPRISLTVPSIVIMIPGLFIYRAVYYIGINSIGNGALWMTRAILIIMFLPMGLFVARLLLDKKWRFSD